MQLLYIYIIYIYNYVKLYCINKLKKNYFIFIRSLFFQLNTCTTIFIEHRSHLSLTKLKTDHVSKNGEIC